MKIILLFLLLTRLLPAQEKPATIIIKSLQLDESNTIREGIELIRKAALKENKFFALSLQLADTHLEAQFPGALTLRNVPVEAALKYLCDSAGLDLTDEEGLWVIYPGSREEGQDERQVTIAKITQADLAALGIFKKPGMGYTTADGKKWPSGRNDKASMIDDRLILRAIPAKTAQFKALLMLHRAGYKVPAINSNQPAKD